MDRPYATYSRTSTTARNAGAAGTRGARSSGYTAVETDVVDGGATYRRRSDYDSDYGTSSGPDYGTSYGSDRGTSYGSEYRSGSRYGYDDRSGAAVHDYDAYDAQSDDYLDDDVYEYEESIDRRWVWVAGVAAAILLVAIICTVVILGGGDSGSVSKTIAATTPTTAAQDAVTTPATTAPPAVTSVAPPPPPAAALSPETVTTIPPSSTVAVAPAPAAAAPVPAVSPRTVTYQVTGDRPLLDLVTVVYTDGQGALQTQFNVALPWVRSVTLDPGVSLTSVTATSLTGHLNCSVTDANGVTLVSQNTNSMIATCTK
ncbi:hypothetical protein H7J06_09175 [Mycobacterium hodleri]|uniref:hypothetical protein n=1 Tax=Mycolicibacterium hodleri TaxID=49897 RepID=UPI0021F3A47D|nr:hypothetical protein [Mycolicibacterium hodleri]MCV7133162.1 hypothetical protein [Mycolicibacterium hodleri]